jgi:hypothetical protein
LELEGLAHFVVMFQLPKCFRLVKGVRTGCAEITLEFKVDRTWICKDNMKLSGNWNLTSQHLLDFYIKQDETHIFFKPLLGTESFVKIEGDFTDDELLIPETDYQSFSFRYYRGPRDENNYAPMFLWKSEDKCVSTQLGTIKGEPHGSWNYRDVFLDTTFHFSCQEQRAYFHIFEPIACTSSWRLLHEHKQVLLIPTHAQAIDTLDFRSQCWNAENNMALKKIFNNPIQHWKCFHVCRGGNVENNNVLELFVDGKVHWRNKTLPGQTYGNWMFIHGVFLIKLPDSTIHIFEPIRGTQDFVHCCSEDEELLMIQTAVVSMQLVSSVVKPKRTFWSGITLLAVWNCVQMALGVLWGKDAFLAHGNWRSPFCT